MTMVMMMKSMALLLLLAAAASTTATDVPEHADDNNIQHQRLRSSHHKLMNATINSEPRRLEVSDLWVDYEIWQTYGHFPDDMKEYLQKEFQLYMRGPSINVFTRIPEPPQMAWPLLKGITVRNHIENKILWSTPNFFIQDGVDAGCRETQPDGTTTPVESALCQEHCTHQGRYCAPLEPAELPANLQRKGKELVKEALRRLCFDGYYHASDHKWFDYLQKFDEAQCYDAEDITSCSLGVIEEVDHCDYNNFKDCVGDDQALVSDIVNDKLEKQLQQAKKHSVTLEELPRVTIGTKKYTGPYTVKDMLQAYCDHFGDDNMKPASCDICGQCTDVRRCLWTLECNGVDFDTNTFLARHADRATTPAPTDSPVTTTDAPAETPIPVATLPPGGIATTETSTTTDTTTSSTTTTTSATNEYGEEQAQANGKEILTFFILALVLSALTAGFFVYRDRRTRQLMMEMEAARHDSSGFRDGDNYLDFVPDNTALEMSPRSKTLDNSSSRGSQSSAPPPMAFGLTHRSTQMDNSSSNSSSSSLQPPPMAFAMPGMT